MLFTETVLTISSKRACSSQLFAKFIASRSISNIDDTTYHCSDGSRPEIRQKKISGVLGAASSVTSIQVANLLRLFKIPQVSFFSTSPELSNKQRFEYFLRTVPSDINQAQAMVEIIKLLNWTYVSVIYEESNYGVKAFEVLEDLLAKNGICLAVKEKLTKDSGVANENVYDHIVNKLLSKPNARGVIIFGSDQEVAQVMRAVKRNNATGYFSWIGSDGWSARNLVSDGNELEVEGTISIQPKANPVPGFDEYFLGLTPQNNFRNPWFIEYWEYYFKCKWPQSQITPYNQLYTRKCSGKEEMSYANGYEPEKQLQFVSDAVLTFGFAFKAMHKDLCQGKPGICTQMLPIDGNLLLKYLKRVSFVGLSGDKFEFTSNGDGPVRYNLIHFKQTEPNQFQWINVGTYEDDRLNLDLNKVQFHLSNREIPVSVCSLQCNKGQAKKYIEGENCCWHCFDCTKYQILITETRCSDCPNGYLPNEEKLSCIQIPEEYVKADSFIALFAIGFSVIGILFTLFVIYVFLKYIDTPVVRASGRELSFVLLIGLTMCFSLTFILLLKPSDIICGVQQLSIGISFAIIYSAILTQSNRIFRIFTSGKKSAKRPNFISPKSQLIICFILVLTQLIFLLLWFAFSPPKAINIYLKREDNQLICASNLTDSYFIAFIYPIVLIVICTVYAILTRKIPEAFNESKHIGFTMYTTCIIWLAFVPIYFTTKTNITLNLTTMSIAINFSATVTLICLFTPKIYIILLHPERNIRQSLMPFTKYGSMRKHCSNVATNSTFKTELAIPTNG
ncbi:metabotropic glutamate receptor 8-like protein [Leptotrombidium deliense]|uniref:Metabotropic glutamate receptor 8-like protein n=1 Tax=Leptotrombidium deliense TaxID=299467 RepID=A0A443SPP4_9ACAR|nr:metabotropic glutamate receptor 8-like protein [Leptotrombidium deliense]